MRIGIPKEIKHEEYRVGMVPDGVAWLVQAGHSVFVQAGAGAGSGYTDEQYRDAGAVICEPLSALYEAAELIVKVKEPQAEEFSLLRPDHVLFAYLHLAPDPKQVQALLASGAAAIAYETVRDDQDRLPLLFPMSEIAGRVAMQAGAHCLEKTRGGRGVLLAGATGVEPGSVLIIGGGVVGLNAADIALGLGAQVTVLEARATKREAIQQRYGNRLKVLASNRGTLEQLLPRSDLVVGAALVPGAKSPQLMSRRDLALLNEGAVLVDVAIDQGGCFETSRPTTHDDPSYIVDGIVHYCVANIPGAVPRTATAALSHATFPYIQALADRGWRPALAADPGFARGLSIAGGKLYCPEVALAQGLACEADGWRSDGDGEP